MSPLFPSADNPRPRQVTFGATLAITGGLVLLFALLDLMTKLESVEVTQALRDNLRSLRLSADVDVDRARDILRYCIMAFAVLSVATVVFGFFSLRRDRSARIGLTVAIGTIGVFSVFGGPGTWLITLYVAISIALLWSRQARDWFDGKPTPTSAASASRGRSGPQSRTEGDDRPPGVRGFRGCRPASRGSPLGRRGPRAARTSSSRRRRPDGRHLPDGVRRQAGARLRMGRRLAGLRRQSARRPDGVLRRAGSLHLAGRTSRRPLQAGVPLGAGGRHRPHQRLTTALATSSRPTSSPTPRRAMPTTRVGGRTR